MSLLERLEREAKERSARIVFPEPEDERIIAACERLAGEGILNPVLVGPPEDLPSEPPEGVEVEVLGETDETARYASLYAERRGVGSRIASRLVGRPLVYAGMMVAAEDADGMVAGISHTTSSVIQAAGLTIGYRKGLEHGSSCFLMIMPRLRGEEDVPVVFADCAVNVDPAPAELADIAVASARSAKVLLGVEPRVAMLSFSTAGSAAHALVDKVKEARGLAAESLEDGWVDGELQMDAALNPEVAARKGVGESRVAGRANVLVFPDLNAANICYKAVQELAGAQAVGPVLQGFNRPVNDLSRGASVDDIVATSIITALQAEN